MLTSEQIELRKKGIGGSDQPIILGMSARMTARELWHVKRGELDPDANRTESDELLAWLGHQIEPVLLRYYTAQTGRAVRRPKITRYHRDLDWMLAHVDGIATGTPRNERRGVECKMRVSTEGWGQAGTSDVPDDVMIQCQQYMTVWRYPLWDVVALFHGAEARVFTVPFDRGISDALVDQGGEFMFSLATGTPPELDHAHPTAPGLLARLHPGTDARQVTLDPSAVHWHAVLEDARSHRLRHETIEKEAKAHLLEMMGYAAIGWLPDGSCYTRKEVQRAGYTVSPTSYTSFQWRKAPR